MDKKNRWRWLVLVAGSLAANCLNLSEKPVMTPDVIAFNKAEQALKQKKYQEAQGNYRELLAKYPDSEYNDDAQFKIGFIYICYKNPGADYTKARTAFKQLKDKYPRSIWVYESNNWIRALELLEKYKNTSSSFSQKSKNVVDEQVTPLEKKITDLENTIRQLTEENRKIVSDNEMLKSVLKKLEALDKE